MSAISGSIPFAFFRIPLVIGAKNRALWRYICQLLLQSSRIKLFKLRRWLVSGRNPIANNMCLTKITLDSQPTHFHLLDFELWKRIVDSARLNGRGWAYEERFLSPRSIHPGQDQLFWGCRQKAATLSYRLFRSDALVCGARLTFKPV